MATTYDGTGNAVTAEATIEVRRGWWVLNFAGRLSYEATPVPARKEIDPLLSENLSCVEGWGARVSSTPEGNGWVVGGVQGVPDTVEGVLVNVAVNPVFGVLD